MFLTKKFKLKPVAHVTYYVTDNHDIKHFMFTFFWPVISWQLDSSNFFFHSSSGGTAIQGNSSSGNNHSQSGNSDSDSGSPAQSEVN